MKDLRSIQEELLKQSRKLGVVAELAHMRFTVIERPGVGARRTIYRLGLVGGPEINPSDKARQKILRELAEELNSDIFEEDQSTVPLIIDYHAERSEQAVVQSFGRVLTQRQLETDRRIRLPREEAPQDAAAETSD